MHTPLRTKVLALRLRLSKPQILGSWNEAAQQANGGSYEDDELTRFRVERMLLNHRVGRLQAPSPATSYAANWLVERLHAIPHQRVVDFGGADGAFLGQLRQRLSSVSGVVIESEALVAALPAELKLQQPYASALPQEFEVFYSACALNYIDHPYDVLEQAFASASVAVVLQRNCLSNEEQFRVQLSSLHANGWGELPTGWPDRLVRYPQRSLQPDRIIGRARHHGFELTHLFGNGSGVIGRPGSGLFGVDLFFARRGDAAR